MREISLDRLRTLVAVADLGSLAAAARALHLAPPTVTLHVAELESRLGARLLLRGRGPVTPTGIGQDLIGRARRLLADADEAWRVVRDQVQGRRGRVRLGASTGAIAHQLPPVLRTLADRHPGIEVQLAVTTSAEAMARLAAGTLDIALVALPQPPQAGVRLRPWQRDPVRGFVPAPWQPPAALSPAWLAARPLILNDGSTQLARLTQDWFARAGERVQPRIELNYNDAVRSLVAAGYGAALLPHEASAPPPDARIAMRPLRPALWRALGLAHRIGGDDGATHHVLAVLQAAAAGAAPAVKDQPARRSVRRPSGP